MRRLRLSLKVGERGRKAGFFNLDFHQEPGLAVTNHQEVHLPLLFVAQVTQLEIAKSQVRPPVYGLEQMAGDHGLLPSEIGRDTSELQSQSNLVCRLLLEKKKTHATRSIISRVDIY